MKHIAIDARIITSSTGTYVERLLHYLQQIDNVNKYSVLVRAKDKNYWQPTAKNFEVVVADFADYSFAEQFAFKKFLRKLKPDLVHFCMPQQPIWYRGKHVTTIHDLTLLKTYNSDKNWFDYHFKQLVGRRVFRKVIKSSRFILAPSEYTKRDILKFSRRTRQEKIIVTPEAADITPEKLIPFNHPFKQFLMYVGQQSDYKNIRRLGEAHQKLLAKYPDLGLILVGKINDGAAINKRYFEKKKFKNILFTGFLPNTQRDWLYANTAAYVFPSLMEGFGLPGLEAMGYGAPVISSNATCLPEVYGDAAHYFNPKDTKAMAIAIHEVLSNETLRQDLIKRGQQQIARYSWQRMAALTHRVYMTALEK